MISIHALHEESDFKHLKTIGSNDISIHALHEESDLVTFAVPPEYRCISIHALHEESDFLTSACLLVTFVFQSTLSMRRATRRSSICRVQSGISIHALHEESDWLPVQRRQHRRISIHALHEESDGNVKFTGSGAQFQSTLSMRRATPLFRHIESFTRISIHALHEESDPAFSTYRIFYANFNPRSP